MHKEKFKILDDFDHKKLARSLGVNIKIRRGFYECPPM